MTDTTAPSADNPIQTLMRICSGLWLSRALWVAARLKIADAIGDEPVSVEAIAAATGTKHAMLSRLLKALATAGFFTQESDGRFGNSELSHLLRSDHPLSQRAFVESVFGGEHYEAWGAIETSLRDGTAAFDHQFGVPVFDYFSRHPEAAMLFSQAMTSTSRLAEGALLASFTPPPFELVIDVGGSGGTLLQGLLQRAPQARGILFDLPDIIAGVRSRISDPRIEPVGGNFFENLPSGDLYLLKFILHDWDDDQSATILRNIRTAIRPAGRVLLIENVLPDAVGPHPGYLMDLNMMVMTGGRERTAAEFGALLEQTSFRVEAVIPTATMLSVIQAIAV